MKNAMRAPSMILALLASFVLLAPSAQAQTGGGSEVGSGGDVYAQEFIANAYNILQRLTSSPIDEIDNDELALAVVKTKVESQERLFLDGREVDAINYRNAEPPKIVMSRMAWDRMRNEPFKRSLLVLHEYLGILGIDDSRYQVSSKLDQAGVCSRSEPVRKAIEGFFKVACHQLTETDLLRLDGELDIDGEVEQYKDHDFALLSSVKAINLRNKKLKRIQPYLFRDLASAELRGLHENQLEVLEAHAFYGLKKSDFLSLEKNRIRRIEPGAFEGFGGWAIILEDNQLTEILPGAFAGADRVSYLRLDRNRLEKVSFEGFPRHLLKGGELHLNRNELTEVPDFSGAGFEKISFLDLRANKIARIGSGRFRNVDIHILELTGNDIQVIEPEAFVARRIGDVFFSGGHVLGGHWKKGMFKGLKGAGYGTYIETCRSHDASGDEGEPIRASYVKSIEPGALADFRDFGDVTLCLDFTGVTKVDPAIFDGLEGVRWLKIYAKNAAAIGDDVKKKFETAKVEFRIEEDR